MSAQPADSPALAFGTGPVPAGPYYRSDYFDLEREAIFRRTWLQVAHVTELAEPGDFIARPIEIANASILITRANDGRVRAFHNVCTHRGTQLVSEASGRRSSFSCPYHRWTFGNDGRLRAAPDFERFYISKDQCNLREVAVDVCGGLVFINLDRTTSQGLREFLGPLADTLEQFPAARATTFAEYVYEIEANWKLTYDNFQENYHLRFIHPRSGEAATGPDNPFGYPVRYAFHGPHRTQTIWSNPAAAPKGIQRIAFGKAAQFAAAEGTLTGPFGKNYLAIFPNFFILGSPISPFSHCVMPISATRSRGVIRLYWNGEDDSASKRFAREYSMATAFDIHSEDRAVIEAGQRGLSSGALDVIHFQEHEVLCRHLMLMVDQHVQAWRAGGQR
jgi:phenylpropionate dioxygenase-like ring-hydroxylating dioxygenase large terminal subunit